MIVNSILSLSSLSLLHLSYKVFYVVVKEKFTIKNLYFLQQPTFKSEYSFLSVSFIYLWMPVLNNSILCDLESRLYK